MDSHTLKAGAKSAAQETERWLTKFVGDVSDDISALKAAVEEKLKQTLTEVDGKGVSVESRISKSMESRLVSLRGDVKRLCDDREKAIQHSVEAVKLAVSADFDERLRAAEERVMAEIQNRVGNLYEDLSARIAKLEGSDAP